MLVVFDLIINYSQFRYLSSSGEIDLKSNTKPLGGSNSQAVEFSSPILFNQKSYEVNATKLAKPKDSSEGRLGSLLRSTASNLGGSMSIGKPEFKTIDQQNHADFGLKGLDFGVELTQHNTISIQNQNCMKAIEYDNITDELAKFSNCLQSDCKGEENLEKYVDTSRPVHDKNAKRLICADRPKQDKKRDIK